MASRPAPARSVGRFQERRSAPSADATNSKSCRGDSVEKAMVSQPMVGKKEEEIIATRERAKNHLESLGYEFVNTKFTDEWYNSERMKERGVVNIPLCFLAKSLENMSLCSVAYFAKGWEQARGCRAEHDVAKAYGMGIIYEPDADTAAE